MQINDADVAELVDARDLKSSGPTENAKTSCKTRLIGPVEMAADPSHLQNISRQLLRQRNRVGRDSRAGRLLSNLIEQRPWLKDETGDRSWATHETQQVAWMMNVQVERLGNNG